MAKQHEPKAHAKNNSDHQNKIIKNKIEAIHTNIKNFSKKPKEFSSIAKKSHGTKDESYHLDGKRKEEHEEETLH